MENNCFSTFLSNGASRATFARTSNCFNNVCAPARATIPCKKYDAGRMRAAAARARRNPSKPNGFSTIASYEFNNTYENIQLFTPKNRNSARALLLNPSNTNCVSTFLSNGASRATFARTSNSFDRFRAPARATIPCKKYDAGRMRASSRRRRHRRRRRHVKIIQQRSRARKGLPKYWQGSRISTYEEGTWDGRGCSLRAL